MIYQGRTLRLDVDADGVAEICFCSTLAPINKFDAVTLGELREAVDALRATAGVRALVLTSALDAFVVGADIKRFSTVFSQPAAVMEEGMWRTHRLFADIEDLPYPTVAAIGGLALGGGLEICLACDYRVMADDTRIGLPEIGLGIFPGWGGSMRLPRLVGVEEAAAWIADGRPRDAAAALQANAVDRVAPAARLTACARELVLDPDSVTGLDARRAARIEAPLPDANERKAVFDALRSRYAAKLDPHYPALSTVLDAMESHTGLVREEAMAVEIAAFVEVARTPTTASLVGLFLNEQYLKKQLRRYTADASAVKNVGVIGSGIMGAGIALQCALAGIDVRLHDMSRAALDRAFAGIDAYLGERVNKGRLTQDRADGARALVHAESDIAALDECELVVEAVVEDRDVKREVLSKLAARLSPEALIATNTSTIAIDSLAGSITGRGRFLGLHFFNPVTAMPLVEVIRGAETVDDAVARAVAFARAIGKHPVVVRDCPGFLVNRVLFPYLNGFERLLHDGVDFVRIDRVMESFGWPMGPARLLDVVGIDTTVNAARIMAESFPERMALDFVTSRERLRDAGRLGEKSGAGYYDYEPGTNRRREPATAKGAHFIIAAGEPNEIDDGDIVARMMVPLCIELVRCLEEEVVDSPEAADMALIRGLGFPRYLGGALRYVDRLGAAAFCETAARFAHLGAAYRPTPGLEAMAAQGRRFFGQGSPT